MKRPITIEETFALTFWASIHIYLKGFPADIGSEIFENPGGSRIINALSGLTDGESKQLFLGISASMPIILAMKENNSDEYWRNILFICENFDYIWNR